MSDERDQAQAPGGKATREIPQNEIVEIRGRVVPASGVTREQELPVSKTFVSELLTLGLINKVDLLPLGQAIGLIAALQGATTDQAIDLGGIRLEVGAIDRTLISESMFTRFAIRGHDPRIGEDFLLYHLPVIDSRTGRVALLQMDLEAKSALQDAALNRRGELRGSTESRLSLPAGFQTERIEKTVVGLAKPFSVEYSSGDLTLAQRRLRVTVASTEGGRDKDEDFVFVEKYNLPEVGEFIIASVKDGIGGQAAGERASQLAATAEREFLTGLKNLASPKWDEIRSLATAKYGGDLRHALIELCVQEQNGAVYAEKQKSGLDLGSTDVEAFIFPDAAYFPSAGDSRAYVDFGQGPFRLTFDHSAVERSRQVGIISADEALQSEQRNLIYRMLGDKPTLIVDITRIPFSAGPKELLLCCDGLWEQFGDRSGGKCDPMGNREKPAEWISAEIGNALVVHSDHPENLAAAAVAVGLTNGNIDNVSFIRIRLEP